MLVGRAVALVVGVLLAVPAATCAGAHLHAGDAKAWLAIGIPSVPRRNGSDYLSTTLGSLLEELPADTTDPLYGRVKVVVMNNQPGQHAVFESVRRRFTQPDPSDAPARKAAAYLEFVDNPGTLVDPAPHVPDPDDLNNPSSRPGRRAAPCPLPPPWLGQLT